MELFATFYPAEIVSDVVRQSQIRHLLHSTELVRYDVWFVWSRHFRKFLGPQHLFYCYQVYIQISIHYYTDVQGDNDNLQLLFDII